MNGAVRPREPAVAASLWRAAQHTATLAAVETAIRFTIEMGRRFSRETPAHPVFCSVLGVLVVGLSLSVTPRHAAAEFGDTVTTVLEPGLNLVGWTGAEASIEAIFEDIPQLELVYAWDAETQSFLWATSTDTSVLGTLHMLFPGVGLWLSIAGEQPVSWTRPVFSQASGLWLREGWNLVAWTGEDRVTATEALRDLDDILTASVDARGRQPTSLTRGGALWLNVSAPGWWEQHATMPRAGDQNATDPTIVFVTPVSAEREAEVRALVKDVVEYFDEQGAGRVPGLTIRWGDPEEFGCFGYYYPADNAIGMTDCTDIFPHLSGFEHHMKPRRPNLQTDSACVRCGPVRSATFRVTPELFLPKERKDTD